jgi:hypothetical protein
MLSPPNSHSIDLDRPCTISNYTIDVALRSLSPPDKAHMHDAVLQ